MAKVINPLLSGTASGQLGHMMTFDKRGYVRKYVIPANPQTTNQMTVRNSLGDIQRELKLMGSVLRNQLKSQFGYRWGALIIGELMANDQAAYNTYAAEWAAFSTADKTAWATADLVVPVVKTDGELLYCVASAVYDIAQRIGAVISLSQPIATNAATVGAEWTDNTP